MFIHKPLTFLPLISFLGGDEKSSPPAGLSPRTPFDVLPVQVAERRAVVPCTGFFCRALKNLEFRQSKC